MSENDDKGLTAVIWLRTTPHADEQELQAIVEDVIARYSDLVAGGRYYFLGHVKDGRKIHKNFERVLKLSGKRGFGLKS